MCVMSMVIDAYRPLFPEPFDVWPQPVSPTIAPTDWQKLIDSFKQATEAAKAADTATGQPDCEDPEKAKLIARVAELEKLLEERVWVVKMGSMYWGVDGSRGVGWVVGQKRALRYYDKAFARASRVRGNARIVRLVKKCQKP